MTAPPEPGPTADPERDAWLRAALRHAPDAELGAPAALSAAILRQSRAAAAPLGATPRPAPRGALQVLLHAWSWLARPPVAAGLASVMLASVVGVMWWDAPLDATLPHAPAPVAPQPERDAAPARDAAVAAAPTGPTAPIAPTVLMTPAAMPPLVEVAPAATTREADAARPAQAATAAPLRAKAAAPLAQAPAPAAAVVPSAIRQADAGARTPEPPQRAADAARSEAATPAASRDETRAAKAANAPGAAALEAFASAPPPPMAAARARAAPAPADAALPDHAAPQPPPAPAALPRAQNRRAAAPAAGATTPTDLLTDLRAAIRSDPPRWTWQRGDGAPQPMNAAVQAWLARLPSSAGPADAAAPIDASVLVLHRDGQRHTSLTLSATGLRIEPADGRAALQADLRAADAAALMAALDDAAPR